MRAYVLAYLRACVHACVRARVRARVLSCARACMTVDIFDWVGLSLKGEGGTVGCTGMGKVYCSTVKLCYSRINAP